jgi:hypothetical protein
VERALAKGELGKGCKWLKWFLPPATYPWSFLSLLSLLDERNEREVPLSREQTDARRCCFSLATANE